MYCILRSVFRQILRNSFNTSALHSSTFFNMIPRDSWTKPTNWNWSNVLNIYHNRFSLQREQNGGPTSSIQRIWDKGLFSFHAISLNMMWLETAPPSLAECDKCPHCSQASREITARFGRPRVLAFLSYRHCSCRHWVGKKKRKRIVTETVSKIPSRNGMT